MDPRLIDFYNDELQHLRREAREFGAEFEAAAAMLALDEGRVEDPYVERLLEGVAFLAARVRLKLDSQYPVFTQQLIEVLFPGWLVPSPSTCLLRLNLDLADDKLVAGPIYGRNSVVGAGLRGVPGARCEFKTSRDVQLLPLELGSISYTAVRPDRMPLSLPGVPETEAESSLSIEINVTGEADLAQLPIDRLPFYVSMDEPHAGLLLELVAGRCVAVACSTDPAGRKTGEWLAGSSVRHIGFDASEAMFPMPARGHAGFRVMREYAAMPEKFKFFELTDLARGLRGLRGRKLYLHLRLGGAYSQLESAVRANSLALFCVPAVNLGEQRFDRIEMQPGQVEYNAVGDRNNVRRYEVVQVLEVVGGGDKGERSFAPVFEVASAGKLAAGSFYTVRRERRRLTQREVEERRLRLQGSGGNGLRPHDGGDSADANRGTEVYLSLAEQGTGTYGRDLTYLSVRALCMDREMPALLRSQAGLASYAAIDTVPVKSIDCLVRPSEPIDYALDGFDPWLVLSHLHVNYLALVDAPDKKGADALRAMLTLYVPPGNSRHFLHREARGLDRVETQQVTRRLPQRGALAFGRGAEIMLHMNQDGFGGGSPFLLGAMIEHCLASHVSINSFVETSVHLKDRSKPLSWRRTPGERPSF